MPKLNLAFLQRPFGSPFLPGLRQGAVGLWGDYWADGPDNLLGFVRPSFLQKHAANTETAKATSAAHQPPTFKPVPAQPFSTTWHAAPGEIEEKMWGDGCVSPGDATLNSLLITPLSLTKAMNVLDLTAGLGSRMRRAMEETGATITGLEPDAAIAERGTQLSLQAGMPPVTAYTPPQIDYERLYDGFIARELFYRTPNFSNLCAGIAVNAKPGAQLAFTDYILDPEFRAEPAILAWQKQERLAKPFSLVETSEIWAKAGFAIRLSEDLTGFYKSEVIAGIKRLLGFLAAGAPPDKETARLLLRHIDLWQCRMAAFQAGLKFYRFYGVKG